MSYEGMLLLSGAVVRLPAILVEREDVAIPYTLAALCPACGHAEVRHREGSGDYPNDLELRVWCEGTSLNGACPCGEPDDERPEPDDWYEQVGRY